MATKVMSVISKKPEARQDFEIQGLLPWLRKKSKLFSTLKTECLKDIVRNCGFQTFKRDDIIIRQGEVGDCFYIILDGKISIFIINKDKDGAGGDGDEQSAFASIGHRDKDGKLDRSKLGNFVVSLGSGHPFGEVALVSDDAILTASILAEEDNTHLLVINRALYNRAVRGVCSGHPFGEVALVSDDAMRTASILAEEDNTQLLVIDRALYNRAVRDVLAEEFQQKQHFIRKNDLLASWIPKYKKQLAMAMYMETYPYEHVLVKQGEPVSNIYFVVSGQVEIQTDPSLHPLQYPKLYKLLEDERDKLIKEKKHVQKQRVEPESSPPPQRKRENSKTIKMCYLGKNESLGELEVLMDMDTYMTTAICSERTEVLVLEMKHYERLFVKRHQRTIDAMRRFWELKLNTRTSVLKDRNEIILLKLIQMQLDLMHNPVQTPPHEKKKKSETSVQIAEKLFFSHQGPLFDIDGPGSVFYMIRAREKSRLKLKAHQKERNNREEKRKHVHSLRLPQSIIRAAHLAGITETAEQQHMTVTATAESKHATATKTAEVKQPESSEIEAVARQNSPIGFVLGDLKPHTGTLPVIEDTLTSTPVPKSFRRIQSAHKAKIEPSEDTDQVVRSQDEYDNKYVSRSHHLFALRPGSGEENLRQLETKVEEWLKKDNPRFGSNVSKLRRIQPEDMEPRPRPGNKIVIRRRSKGKRSDISNGTGSSETVSDQPVKAHNSYSSNFSANASANPLDKFKILLTS